MSNFKSIFKKKMKTDLKKMANMRKVYTAPFILKGNIRDYDDRHFDVVLSQEAINRLFRNSRDSLDFDIV